jgi:hypothetical protein
VSDAALEQQYEESLQACRTEGHPRLFFFRVDGLEVGVCPKCHQRFVADPMQGDGSEWDQAAREAANENPAGEATSSPDSVPSSVGLDAAVADHPAGGRSNVCAFCRPRVLHGPSGKGLWHEATCSDKPGQKISAASYVGIGRFDPEPWRGRA